MCLSNIESLIKDKIYDHVHDNFATILPSCAEVFTQNWGPQNGSYQNEELESLEISPVDIEEPDGNNCIHFHALAHLVISADIVGDVHGFHEPGEPYESFSEHRSESFKNVEISGSVNLSEDPTVIEDTFSFQISPPRR